MIEKKNLQCEIACAGDVVKQLQGILELDLSNFEGKVLNCKFEKVIGHPVHRESTGCRSFKVYPEKNFIWVKTEHGQDNTFTQWHSKHTIQFSVDDNTNRINVQWFKSGVQTMINHLTENIAVYKADLELYDSLMKLLKEEVDQLQKMTKALSYTMRLNLKEMLKVI